MKGGHLNVRHILVEDNAHYRRTLSNALHMHLPLISVDEACDGREVLSKVKYQRPDIIFMETQLPGKTDYKWQKISSGYIARSWSSFSPGTASRSTVCMPFGAGRTIFFQRKMTSVWRTSSHGSMWPCPEHHASDSGAAPSHVLNTRSIARIKSALLSKVWRLLWYEQYVLLYAAH